jgi:hypothetical protein
MTPLPEPERGGSITDLRKFLNVKSDADFVMVVSWLLAAFRNRGPYPVLVLTGEQGSAKSTLSAILRSLIDPNVAPLRSLPREIRDLFIAANNGHALVFDNLSSLTDWLSDALCRLATGGAFAVRQNYTDQDEVLFDAVRPIILNGIEDVATKGDLVERSIVSMLTPIDESKRKTEAELWASFEAARPRLLGALLNAVSRGIKRLPQTTMEKLPRMADFALWATACETEFCPPGTTFNSAYSSNRDNAVEIAIEASPLAAAIRSLMAGRTGTEWTGTSTQLLADLASVAGEGATKSRAWPKAPNALSSKLRRAAPDLRKVGIETAWDRGNMSRTIIITTVQPAFQKNGETSSPSAPTPGFGQSSSQNNGLAGDDHRGGRDDPKKTITEIVTPNSLKSNEGHEGDDGDDKTRDHSAARAVCAQCGAGPSTDPPSDPPQMTLLQGGKSVWLHPECRRFHEEAMNS